MHGVSNTPHPPETPPPTCDDDMEPPKAVLKVCWYAVVANLDLFKEASLMVLWMTLATEFSFIGRRILALVLGKICLAPRRAHS